MRRGLCSLCGLAFVGVLALTGCASLSMDATMGLDCRTLNVPVMMNSPVPASSAQIQLDSHDGSRVTKHGTSTIEYYNENTVLSLSEQFRDIQKKLNNEAIFVKSFSFYSSESHNGVSSTRTHGSSCVIVPGVGK